MKYFFYRTAIVFLLFIFSSVLSQELTPSVLISLPGENRNFEVKPKRGISFLVEKAGICFENVNDSIYSICYRQIKPLSDEILFVASDTIPKSNPAMSWFGGDSIRLVWQQLLEGKWQIFSRVIINGDMTPVRQLTRAAENNTSPQVSGNKLIWINDLYLTYAEIADSLINIKKIDGSDCANPKIHPQQLEVLYEQQVDTVNNIIKRARYIDIENRWDLDKLINRGRNKNPRYDTCLEPALFTYQKLDTVWKSYAADLNSAENMWASPNHDFDVTKPVFFIYPIPTKAYIRDWFVVYESDSLENNKEIILNYTYGQNDGPRYNLSNMQGDDINPFIVNLSDSIAIFYEHVENNSSQIYWAKAEFRPYSAIDENLNAAPNEFSLKQNYPNPFNPSTTIEFYLPRAARIDLSVYNLTGEKIRTLAASEYRSGRSKVVWDGNNENGAAAASGIYFYVLRYEGKRLSKKMLLLR